jgi:hypothetical protein
MKPSLIHVPAPSTTDSETVKTALEVAAASWERGDSVAAIRWLRRAAEAADADGDMARMAALARVAAELEQARPVEAERRSPTPPAPSIPPPPASGPTLKAGPPSKPTSLPRPSAPPSKPPAPPPSHRPPVPSAGRVRVSVKISVRDPLLLVVRPLAEGEMPPEGSREAFLVMADGTPLDLPVAKRSVG